MEKLFRGGTYAVLQDFVNKQKFVVFRQFFGCLQKDNLDQKSVYNLLLHFFSLFAGLEDFENKVDKVTKGADGDENSWISQIFQKYGHSIFDINEDLKSMEGLEPPMLDETWGFDKIDDNEIVPTLEIQRKHKPNEDQFEKELEGD